MTAHKIQAQDSQKAMFHFFKSEWFDFELVRLLGFAPYEGAEIAEVLQAVGSIRDSDAESWHTAWLRAGSKTEALAQEAEDRGDRLTARRAYLRSSNYIRAAQYMLSSRKGHIDPRVLPTLERAIANFRRATQLMDGDVHCLEIPYEKHIALPGYLYLPPAERRLSDGKIPILINIGGGDSTQEELYFINPTAGVQQGYAVLTYEGPGQGILLRREGLTMRPDWEVVNGKVLDFLEVYAREHPELDLDLDRIGVCGASMGGYFALRAAADARVKACISIDPFYCMWDIMKGRMPEYLIHMFETDQGCAPDSFFNGLVRFLQWANFQARWEFNHLKTIFGVEAPSDAFRAMMTYTLSRSDEKEYLADVHCPVFVTGAAAALYAKPEFSTDRIYNALGHLRDQDKLKWIAADAAQGGLQAKVGAFGLSAHRTFAWLDQHFGIDRKITYKPN
ncbi:hypothetical protein CBS147343_4671 [Aspergillus niger]|nr:hypothetical protein CBS11350_4848 [Aspergillus niger]KAI2864828.1 hypothetical protein CBS12448_2455 [Aspergillus niger]KAI2977380.1 hypothetical protein CBS147324_2054 [Aspergillus niger]KAI3018470.1 hypothetical protein CBS147482_2512 [Aspergillus niger]KAI3055423.1 hypothetical protein CBS147352_2876 [Aspergillus niger]